MFSSSLCLFQVLSGSLRRTQMKGPQQTSGYANLRSDDAVHSLHMQEKVMFVSVDPSSLLFPGYECYLGADRFIYCFWHIRSSWCLNWAVLNAPNWYQSHPLTRTFWVKQNKSPVTVGHPSGYCIWLSSVFFVFVAFRFSFSWKYPVSLLSWWPSVEMISYYVYFL